MNFFEFESLRNACAGRALKPPDRAAMPSGVAIDSREDLTGKVFVAIPGPNHDGHDFIAQAVENGARTIIVQRAIDLKTIPDDVGVIAVDDTRRALLRMAGVYRRQMKGTRIIAITGSSGKTTTKQIIHDVLSVHMKGHAAPKSFNNDIGVPLTLLNADRGHQYVVVEVGTNAPGEIAQLARIVQPHIAVITSIGRAHLGGFGSVEAIAREKASLLNHLDDRGLAVIPAEADVLSAFIPATTKTITFGEDAESNLRLTGWGQREDHFWFSVNDRQSFEFALPGRHNAMNALAAVAVARRMGLDDDQIAQGMRQVRPVAMRMQVTKFGEITVFNDAYNANPESMRAAIDTFTQLTETMDAKRVLILGDMLELGDDEAPLHREIGEHVLDVLKRIDIERVITVGKAAKSIARLLRQHADDVEVNAYAKLTPAAITRICNLIPARSAVLLKASRGLALERIAEALHQRHHSEVEVKTTKTPAVTTT